MLLLLLGFGLGLGLGLSLSWLCLRGGRFAHGRLHHRVLVFKSALKEEVRGKLLVLIAGEVRLRCLVLAEAQGHQALDRFHFLLAHAHDALIGMAGLAALGHASLGHTTLRASTSTSTSGSSSHDEVHKSHGVLLNYLV